MSVVVGFNWFIEHDNIAAAIVDGKLVFATEEERFTRHKHSPLEPPVNAMLSLFTYLENIGIKPADVNAYAVNFDPKLYSWSAKRDIFPSTTTTIRNYLGGYSKNWKEAALCYIGIDYMRLATQLVRHVIQRYGAQTPSEVKIYPIEHHLAHAASAYYFSGYDNACVVTVDGSGELESTAVWKAKNGEFEKVLGLNSKQHSLGSFYEVVAQRMGFSRLEGAGKVMGLAPYGNNSHYYEKLRSLIEINEAGNAPYEFRVSKQMTRIKHQGFFEQVYWRLLKSVLSDIDWNPKGEMSKDAANLAWAVQKVTEEALIATAKWSRENTGENKLAFAGGVALNAKASMIIHYSKIFDDMFTFPAANDAGTPIGAAAYVYEHIIGGKMKRERLRNVYLGPSYSDEEIGAFIQNGRWRSEQIGNDLGLVADLVAQGKIIAWYQGRAELGPRALGNRSIVADPRNKEMWKLMNLIKGREWWRPLAPSMLEEDIAKYFLEAKPHEFMIMMYKFTNGKGLAVPAVCHVDETARPQTVRSDQNSNWRGLIESFREITGESMVVNTSFNLAGEPLVETPRDAIRSFAFGGFDAMYMQGWLLKKSF